ncbi:MAG: methylase, partial [Herbinix sp.]|nr:methylase [Herbinix sp.]
MRVDYQVKQIYDMMIQEVATSEPKWREVCRLMGQLYRYEFDNILMIYAQRPHATLVADFDTWKKVNRYVMRGSKGIAIFPSRALHPRMRYVFDIGDTGGKKQDLTWDLNGEKLTDFVAFMITSGLFKEESNQVDSDALDAQDILQKILKTQLKDFTRTYVRAIIKEDYSDRINELTRLVGEYGLEKDDIMNEADNSPDSPVAQFIYQSAFYAIGTRCGFDLDIQEQDFGSVLRYQSEDEIYLIGTLVSDISCNVLRDFARNLKQMEKQRMLLEERGITHGRDRIDLYGEGGNPISESGVTEGGRAEFPQPWEIRNDGIELSDGERTGSAQDFNEIRIVDTENVRSGRRGESASGYSHDGLSGEEQAERSKFHDRDVADQRAGEDAGRGNRIESDRIEISLEQDQIESEIKQELDEINSFGKQGEANYQQASFSFNNAVGQTKYTYLEPKKELIVPHEYVVEVILRGSGFANGKGRIATIYQNESVPSERAKLIKKEYGLGGAGWPIDGYGLHGYDTFKNQGIRFKWRDEEGEKEGYVSWAVIEREIGALILTGSYDLEQSRNDTKTIEVNRNGSKDIDREDEYEDDREEWAPIKQEQQWIDDEILDEFSIPDELDEMQGVAAENGSAEELSDAVMQGISEESSESIEKDAAETSKEIFNVISEEVPGEIPKEVPEDMPQKILEKIPEGQITDDRFLNDPDFKGDIASGDMEAGSLTLDLMNQDKQNFYYTQLEVDTAGVKTRYKWNVKAIRTLSQIEGEERLATSEEQKVLAKYVGWGGLSQVFNEADNSWRHEYVELKNLLSEDDYTAARATVNNAFYTSPEIASCINQALVQFGFHSGNILEPSMGTGNFFGSLPTSLQDCNLFGVEIDSISGRIAKQLYQNADIRITGFENTSFPDNFFDVAIGNVPFGDYKVFDSKYNKLNFRIHDYFLAKAIDQVRPGGIVAFITTKGTLDKSNPSVRKYLAERAELIGAIRLPNTAFHDFAGTDVATDILFLQKRVRAIV